MHNISSGDDDDEEEDDDGIFILTIISIYQTCQEISRQLSDSHSPKTKNNIANHLSMSRFKSRLGAVDVFFFFSDVGGVCQIKTLCE